MLATRGAWRDFCAAPGLDKCIRPSGARVVSTRSGGPEGIVTDGDDGYLVARDDAPALSARLGQLLGDSTLAAEMGASARRTIERRYDERVVGQSFVDVWHQLGKG